MRIVMNGRLEMSVITSGQYGRSISKTNFFSFVGRIPLLVPLRQIGRTTQVQPVERDEFHNLQLYKRVVCQIKHIKMAFIIYKGTKQVNQAEKSISSKRHEGNSLALRCIHETSLAQGTPRFFDQAAILSFLCITKGLSNVHFDISLYYAI